MAPRDERSADSHDMIRVQGARENNLKDVSVELPKRRLTVFTGVSGSGKSSLVFATIAAESQRLINETYSAFVQGFMPSLARPEVDLLEGLTTAIIVDQERMGANSRSTVGTATDANAMLRIVFSRLGVPSAGPAFHYSFNEPAGRCPRCEGMGTVTDIDHDELFDRDRSLAQGAITIPGYTADGWNVRIFAASGFLDPEKPIRDYTKQELHDFLYKEPVKIKFNSINLTYEGLVPKVQKSFLQKDKEALQPHIRAFVERAVTFIACQECRGSRLNQAALASRIDGINIADACAMQINNLAEWVRRIKEPSVAPLLAHLGQTLDSLMPRTHSARLLICMAQASAMLMPSIREASAAWLSRLPRHSGHAVKVTARSTNARLCGWSDSLSFCRKDFCTFGTSPSYVRLMEWTVTLTGSLYRKSWSSRSV